MKSISTIIGIGVAFLAFLALVIGFAFELGGNRQREIFNQRYKLEKADPVELNFMTQSISVGVTLYYFEAMGHIYYCSVSTNGELSIDTDIDRLQLKAVQKFFEKEKNQADQKVKENLLRIEQKLEEIRRQSSLTYSNNMIRSL